MKEITKSGIRIIPVLRYFARLFSILLIFVVFTLALGEISPRLTNMSLTEIVFISSLLIMLIGLLISWKWEGIGGTVIIAGFVLFYLINPISSKSLNLGFFFLLFPLTGILYLICCFTERNTKSIRG